MSIEPDFRKLLKECLESTVVATIATFGSTGINSAPVFFTFDKDFNIYFISNRATRHMANIMMNSAVALSIFKPIDSVHEAQVGVQIQGIASEVPQDKVQEIYDSRARKIHNMTSFSRGGIEASLVKAHEGVFICVTSSAISYINTEVFRGDIIEVSINELTKND